MGQGCWAGLAVSYCSLVNRSRSLAQKVPSRCLPNDPTHFRPLILCCGVGREAVLEDIHLPRVSLGFTLRLTGWGLLL